MDAELLEMKATHLFRTPVLICGLAPAIAVVAILARNDVVAHKKHVADSQNVHSVSGIVRMQGNGKPVVGAQGRIVRKEDAYVVLGSQQAPGVSQVKTEYHFTTDKNGQWSVSNLADGSYLIQVDPGRTDSDRSRSEKFVTKKQIITLAGTDLDAVLIEVSRGARISGIVVIEGNQLGSSLSLSAVKVDTSFELLLSKSVSLTPSGEITAFTMTEVPEGEIELSAFLQTDSHYIKTINAKGVDLLREHLSLSAGMELADVRVVVSSEVAEFTGRVLAASEGTPLPRIRLLMTEIGPDKRRILGGRLTGRTDQQGQFLLRPPPGDYRVDLFWSHAEGGFLSSVHQNELNPLQISFQAGERKSMDIRVP